MSTAERAARVAAPGDAARDAGALADLVRGLEGVRDRGVTFVDERWRERRLAWSDLHAAACEAAAALRAAGARPGQRVLAPVASSPPAVAGLLGALLADLVPLTVPPSTDRASTSRAESVSRAHGLAWALDPAGDAVRVVSLASPDLARDAPRDARASRGDLALVQFSSGSTRAPAGVELTHGAVLANLAVVADADARGPRAVHATWLPLSHDMGLVGGLLASLVHAHELVLMAPACFVLRPLSWLEILSTSGATSTAAPDFALALACERLAGPAGRRLRLDLSALAAVHDGAEPVRPATVRRAQERLGEHGLRPHAVRPVYGLAEATLMVTSPAPGEPACARTVDGVERAGVGRPVPGTTLRVLRADGRDARPGEVGSILLRGPSVMRGYHGDAAATREALRDGWLATGDLGLLDDEGRLFVTGRAKDVLVAGGRKFSGAEVGALVDELPFARRGHSHAVSVPRADGSEEIVVLLAPGARGWRRLRRGAEAAAEVVGRRGAVGRLLAAAFVRGAAAVTAWARPRRAPRLRALEAEHAPAVRAHVARELGLSVDRVTFVAQLPRTTSGKVARAECARLAADGVARAAARLRPDPR